MFDLKLTENERNVLTQALRATVEQLDTIMEQGLSGGANGYEDLREVADASNCLADIIDKLEKDEK